MSLPHPHDFALDLTPVRNKTFPSVGTSQTLRICCTAPALQMGYIVLENHLPLPAEAQLDTEYSG